MISKAIDSMAGSSFLVCGIFPILNPITRTAILFKVMNFISAHFL